MMVRKPYLGENGVQKGAWSPEEDNKLRVYIERYGHWNWRELPKFAGLARCGKSCRLRWINYLQPNIKRGNYSREEEDLIIKLHEQLGNRWSTIAAKLPGRTDNDIKNHWHTYLKKRVQNQYYDNTKTKTKKGQTTNKQNSHNAKTNPSIQILESCPVYPMSPQLSSAAESSPCWSSETYSGIIDEIENSGLGSGSGLGSSSSIGEATMISCDAMGQKVYGSESVWLDERFTLGNDKQQENDFSFLDVVSSPYMSCIENMDFTSLLSEAGLLDVDVNAMTF